MAEKCPKCGTKGLHEASMWTPDEVPYQLEDPICHGCHVRRQKVYYNHKSRSRGAQRANAVRWGQDDDETDRTDNSSE